MWFFLVFSTVFPHFSNSWDYIINVMMSTKMSFGCLQMVKAIHGLVLFYTLIKRTQQKCAICKRCCVHFCLLFSSWGIWLFIFIVLDIFALGEHFFDCRSSFWKFFDFWLYDSLKLKCLVVIIYAIYLLLDIRAFKLQKALKLKLELI